MPDSPSVLYLSTNTGGTYVQEDALTPVDNVYTFLRSDGNVWRLIVDGKYRAAYVCRTAGDKTTELQTVYDHATVDDVIFDKNAVTISGTLNCGGKRITIKEGGRLEGSGTISNAIIDYNWVDDAIDSALTLTGCTHISGVPILSSDATADAKRHIFYYNSVSNKFRHKTNGTWYNVASNETSVSFVIGNGVDVISTGIQFYVPVAFDCTVTGWSITENTGTSSSIVVDIYKDTYGNFPPTVADTITGTEKPTLATATKNQDLALTTWITALTRGEYLGINVDSVTAAKQVTITINLIRL